jgi:hypothetical protein
MQRRTWPRCASDRVVQVGHEFVEALLRLAMLRYKKVRAQ